MMPKSKRFTFELKFIKLKSINFLNAFWAFCFVLPTIYLLKRALKIPKIPNFAHP